MKPGAVEASFSIDEIATGERMTPGQNEPNPAMCGALRHSDVLVFQVDFWTEASHDLA